MLRNVIKRTLSLKQREKIFRMRQYLKDSAFLKKDFRIFTPLHQRINDEVFAVSAISDITLKGWRNILTLYEKCSQEEQNWFTQNMRAMILADLASLDILVTDYMKNVFSKHQPLYLEFLGISYYANGKVEKALEIFEELNMVEPSERTVLFMSRCLMQTSNNSEVVELLIRSLKTYPDNTILLLSLANTFYRDGQTNLANDTLDKISKEGRDGMKKKAHNVENLELEILEALNNKTIIRPIEKLGFQSYTEEGVQTYWETLFFHFVAKTRFQHGWSDLCYISQRKLEEYVKKYPEVKSVLNFGVFCGVPDYNLAVTHPQINFIGVDREFSTKKLNDIAFHSQNLSFHAIDMMDIIYDDRKEVKKFVTDLVANHGELLIFHARTTTLIYPEAVKKFYKACASLKVKYIALYENMSLSRTHFKYFDFDDLPADSIPYFSIMMIHNYKKFLEEAGYEILEKEIWNYSELLWEGRDLYGTESYFGLGDGHVVLLARLR